MISTGIVRSIDSLGRVVLPKELRTTYDITPDTPLEIFTDGDSIIMRKYHAQGSCVFCGDISPDAVLLHGKYVCPVCRKALGEVRPALPVISPFIQKKGLCRRTAQALIFGFTPPFSARAWLPRHF